MILINVSFHIKPEYKDTFLDEVHAVGLYGPRGAGVAEHLDYEVHKRAGQSPDPIPGTVMDRIDIITGGFCFHFFFALHRVDFLCQVLLARLTAPLAVTSQVLRTSST